MIEAIIKAAQLELYRESAEPFTAQMPRKHAYIVGGTHLRVINNLFPTFALTASILIPPTIAALDSELEMERAVQFETKNKSLCNGAGFAKNLDGIDTDSGDILMISTITPSIRDEFLRGAARVIKDLGKIIIFTPAEIPISHLVKFGLANPIYFTEEGFYVATVRKIRSIYYRN